MDATVVFLIGVAGVAVAPDVSKFLQIRDYWANAQGQTQTSGH